VQAEPEKTSRVAGLWADGWTPIGTEQRPTKGSCPLGDSSALVGLRYATGATHRIIGMAPTQFHDRGIEVKQ